MAALSVIILDFNIIYLNSHGPTNGLCFTFFIPGIIFRKFFRLKSYELLVLVPIFSVMVSTHLIYCLSFLLGYSRETILASFLILTGLYVVLDTRWKDVNRFRNFLKLRSLT